MKNITASAAENLTGAVRVAVVADTHGFLDQRVAVKIATCRLAVHAGDIGCRAILKTLQNCAGEVIAIRGNNDVADKWPAGEQESLHQLPKTRSVELPGGVLIVVHGDRYSSKNRHAKLRRQFPEARAIVYGHSHRLVVDKQSRPWILNPGAAGRSRTYGGPSCLILSASTRAWRISEYRYEPLARARK